MLLFYDCCLRCSGLGECFHGQTVSNVAVSLTTVSNAVAGAIVVRVRL